MNKIITGLVIVIMFILGLGAWDIRQNNIKTIMTGETHKGFVSDITTAVTGHVDDLFGRITGDDEVLIGNKLKEIEFKYTKDSIHWAKGSAWIVESEGKYYIQLLHNFEAGLAPDLYIYTSPGKVLSQDDVDFLPKNDLQKLKKGKGATFYEIKSIDNVKSVVIWCKAFNQWMGTAIVS